jgi:hypothetical protein
MLPKLQDLEYRGDYRIWIKFADGVEGEVDLEKELWGEMFEPLKVRARFAELSLDENLETIVWPNGADFAPEFLYEQLCPGYALKPTQECGAA